MSPWPVALSPWLVAARPRGLSPWLVGAVDPGTVRCWVVASRGGTGETSAGAAVPMATLRSARDSDAPSAAAMAARPRSPPDR